MQHLNPRPPEFPAAARQDEVSRLGYELAELQAKRAKILADIETVHASMLARVTNAVAQFEREFWETDYHVGKSMDRLNDLRADNTPLRTQIWDLQAKIKELESK